MVLTENFKSNDDIKTNKSTTVLPKQIFVQPRQHDIVIKKKLNRAPRNGTINQGNSKEPIKVVSSSASNISIDWKRNS